MACENVIKAIMDGSYRTKSVDDLSEMLIVCMDIHGPNPIAMHRITHAAEIIRAELASRFLSGKPTWLALRRAVDDLVQSAPKDHDVVIQCGDVSVVNARFIEPHTFLFEGINHGGHQTGKVIHFSKLDAQVVFLPKRGPQRVITGFADGRGA